MTDVFKPLSPAQRAAFTPYYLDYLHVRDGIPDRETHTFSIREKYFREIDGNPIRRAGTPVVDQSVFDRNHSQNVPEAGLDEATLWALCMAKVNRAERFGVELSFETNGVTAVDERDPFVFVEIEETYHTRILKDALSTIGVEMEMMPPRGMTRFLITTIATLPKALSSVLILCAEIGGVVVFQMLRDKARELFADQRVPMARIETLFNQIVVDELGHIQFVRSLLGPARLAMARRMLPMIAKGLLDDIPELHALFGEQLVAAVINADIDAIARDYPERLLPIDELVAPTYVAA